MTPLPIANVSDSFQVLFRTSDSHDNATWAVTTVFIPNTSCNQTSACNNRLVSYQIPYDTSYVDASPSFGLQWGEPYGELALMLRRGWWVSAPDHESPLASYGANIVSGYVTIDSVRAVLAVAHDYGFDTNNSKSALWGYSNGGAATEMAAEMVGKYAPELKLSGAVVGGLCPATTNATASNPDQPSLNGTAAAGLVIQGLLGITSQYPDQRAYMVSRLKPNGTYNATDFMAASYMSGWDALVHYYMKDVYAYFQNGISDLLTPGFQAMFAREGITGDRGLYNMPVFHYHAIQDGFTLIDDTDNLVKKACNAGANVLYHRNSVGDHNGELTNGRQRAMDYLGYVLDGTPAAFEIPKSGCQTVNLTLQYDGKTPFH
jgi:hypothetical protein